MNKTLFCALLFANALMSNAQIPYVYDMEYSGKQYEMSPKVDIPSLPMIEKLPDPFLFQNGKVSNKFKDWEHHRYEISQLFQTYEIGPRPGCGKESVSAVIEDGKNLKVTVKHNGEELVITGFIQYPEKVTGPCPTLLGVSNCLPTDLFLKRGCAILNINVFDVCSHTQKRGNEPINKLYPELIDNGSYSYWGWCVSRVIDALQILGDNKTRIDTKHLAVSGCSWAGKAALYAGAFDERIRLVIPQESGGGGVAAWRYSETLGEVERSHNTNDSWFYANIKTDYAKENTARMPVDHHELCAMVCPRALLFFGNTDYKWLADESGYVSINAAKEVYKAFGIQNRIGYCIEGGHGHCQLPESQWKYVEAYIDRFLLDKEDVNTEFTYAPMFENVNWKKWISDWK